EKPDPSAPRVDADPTTRSLLVRATGGQVAQIRELLQQLGESGEGTASAKSKEHVRLLPLSGATARSALNQLQQIWPTLRTNTIRVVAPSQSIQTYRPSDSGDAAPTAPSSDAPNDNGTMPADIQQILRGLQQPAPATGGAPQDDSSWDRSLRDADKSADNG